MTHLAIFHQQNSASTFAPQSIFAKLFCDCISLPILPHVNILLCTTMHITTQSGLHAVMIIYGTRNGARQSTLSGSSGRYAGIDVAQLPTSPQSRDLETLRRRDSDEVSAVPRPLGVMRLPIMTPEARKHHLSNSASSFAAWIDIRTEQPPIWVFIKKWTYS